MTDAASEYSRFKVLVRWVLFAVGWETGFDSTWYARRAYFFFARGTIFKAVIAALAGGAASIVCVIQVATGIHADVGTAAGVVAATAQAGLLDSATIGLRAVIWI